MRQLRVASGEDRLQVVQESAREFRVRVVNDSGHAREPAACRLAEEIRALVGEPCDVTVEWVDVLPPEANGKMRMVISKVGRT